MKVDPRTLIPSDLLGPLDEFLAIYGHEELNAQNLLVLRRKWDKGSSVILPSDVGRHVIEVPDVDQGVVVYVINAARGASRPAVLHLHGGGYVAESARAYVPYLRGVARALGCVVATVEYRLAPETVFPGALDDSYAALRWIWESASVLGVDRNRIAVMGESAGGGYAAMLAIRVRDRKEFRLAAQVLTYPMLDDRTGSSHSVPLHVGTYIWRPRENQFGWSSLLAQPAGERGVPYGSVPARQCDLSDLPPAFIGTGSIDLFADEDIQYAKRLLLEGVPVELIVVSGAYHAFDQIAPRAQSTRKFRAAQLGALRRAFSGPLRR